MDYKKYLNKSKEKYNELDQIKKDAESIESTMMKPKMKHIDSDMQDSTQGRGNANQGKIIQAENFTMELLGEPKTDFNVQMSIDDNVKNLAKLDTDTIIADLERLANKHPEFFKKPSDAFKLLREVKENPTFFYKNNVPDIALIAKRLQNDDLGKLGIRKDNGEVRHLSKSKFDKENARLSKRSEANPLVESPYSTQPVLPKGAEPTAMVHKELSKDIDNQSSLVGIVNSDTLTQDEMDELTQDALLANLDETITDNTLNKAESESTHTRRKP